MPVSRNLFYSKNSNGNKKFSDEESSSTSEHRWVGKVPPEQRNITIAASDQSVLSAPTSGFSSPCNKSINTSPPSTPLVVPRNDLSSKKVASVPEMSPFKKCETWIKSVPVDNKTRHSEKENSVPKSILQQITARSKRLSSLCRLGSPSPVKPNKDVPSPSRILQSCSPQAKSQRSRRCLFMQSSKAFGIAHLSPTSQSSLQGDSSPVKIPETPCPQASRTSSPDLFAESVVSDLFEEPVVSASGNSGLQELSVKRSSTDSTSRADKTDLRRSSTCQARDNPKVDNSRAKDSARISNSFRGGESLNSSRPTRCSSSSSKATCTRTGDKRVVDEFDEVNVMSSRSRSLTPSALPAGISPSKLSPYQRFRLKNVKENEVALQRILRDNAFSVEKSSIGSTSKTDKADSNRTSKRQASHKSPQPVRLPSSSETAHSKCLRTGDRREVVNHDETESESRSDTDESYAVSSQSPSAASSDSAAAELQCNASEAEGGISDDDVTSENSPPAVTKKAQKAQNKVLRNSGKKYITPKGKVIAERVPKQIHKCKRLKCADNITEEDAKIICSEYWAQGSYEKRKLYVASRIEEIPKKRSRPRVPGSGISKGMSCRYYLYVNKKKVQVCRATFLDVLCETDSFVRRIVSGKTLSGTVQNDKRGKKPAKKKLSSAKKQEILDHINSFPKYVSHYCRNQTSQRYLPSHLSYESMHRSYKEQVSNPVSYWTYRRVFKTLNLKFKPPNKDTCAKCDSFAMKIKVTADEAEKEKIKQEMELHKRKADAGYLLKRESRKKFEPDETKRVLIFDLEQCLPTPFLKCSEVYYARQLYVFNLTIYDTTTKITHCYMWHEGEANRGANEIASCLFRHCLDELPESVKHIRFFSDSCTGQNKNSIVAAMFLALLQEKESIHTIDHIFLVPGHTRMECDNKHSVIERAKRTVECINVPSEWYSLVDAAGRTNPEKFPDGRFKVIQMKGAFYDFSDLLSAKGPLVKRSQDDDGNTFSYQKTCWFQYKKNNFTVSVKSSFNEDAYFKKINFLRNKKNLQSGLQLVSKLSPLPETSLISEKKKEDLIKLLKFVPSIHHRFYKNLKTEVLEDMDPDLPSDQSIHSDTDPEF